MFIAYNNGCPRIIVLPYFFLTAQTWPRNMYFFPSVPFILLHHHQIFLIYSFNVLILWISKKFCYSKPVSFQYDLQQNPPYWTIPDWNKKILINSAFLQCIHGTSFCRFSLLLVVIFLLLVFNKTEGGRENCYHPLGHFLVMGMEV